MVSLGLVRLEELDERWPGPKTDVSVVQMIILSKMFCISTAEASSALSFTYFRLPKGSHHKKKCRGDAGK